LIPTRPLIAAAAAVVLLTVAGCGGGGRDHREEAGGETGPGPMVPVRTAALEARAIADAVTAPGVWRSSGELVVAAPVAGVVESLATRIGDRVAPGQRLGTLVTRDSWAAIKGAELLLGEARDPGSKEEAVRALALARRDLVRIPLIARSAGAVVRRSVEPGAQVTDGAEVVARAPSGTVVFEAHVAAEAAGRVKPGQPAEILEPGAETEEATVERVLPMASASDQASLIWLAPRRREPSPELGRFATARISVGPARRVVAVPDSALVEDDLTGERRIATVQDGGRLSWVVVTLGAGDAGWHEVTHSRLAAGTRVVIEGQRGLPDGTRVQPLP